MISLWEVLFYFKLDFPLKSLHRRTKFLLCCTISSLYFVKILLEQLWNFESYDNQYLCKSESVSGSFVSDSLLPPELQLTRLLCLWNSPGQNTRVGSHSLLQRIFLAQGSLTQGSYVLSPFLISKNNSQKLSHLLKLTQVVMADSASGTKFKSPPYFFFFCNMLRQCVGCLYL